MTTSNSGRRQGKKKSEVCPPSCSPFLNEYDLADGKCHYWKIGGLDIYIQAQQEMFFFALDYTDNAGAAKMVINRKAKKPARLIWERWPARGIKKSIRLNPLLPDRAVIARPETPIHIIKGQEENIFISIPLWVSITAGNNKDFTTAAHPVQTLSNTWFGEPTHGELCYALHTTARQIVSHSEFKTHTVICPVKIINNFSGSLNFKRLCIQTEQLAVYESGGRLFSNQVTLVYQGPEKSSKINYSDSAPLQITGASLPATWVTPPRKKGKSLIHRSFDNFISQTFYG